MAVDVVRGAVAVNGYSFRLLEAWNELLGD